MKFTETFALLALSLPLAITPLSWAGTQSSQSSSSKPTSAAHETTTPVGHETATPAATGGKQPAKFLSGTDPDYSESAREKNIEGTVILSVAVYEKGKVTSVKVVNPLESSLDRRAVRAVKHWRFSPATLDGKPVASEFNVSVDFRLTQ